MKQYNFKEIEKKWQRFWEKDKLFGAKDFSKQKKYYCLVEFPYPSGEGLHIGHTRSYTAMDIIARKRRMEGYNVIFPIGWDAFGLPTENYAIKTGIHPKVATQKNTDNFRRQLKSLGFSFDWNREINTTDPDYYKWTQWIFLQFFKRGLAYKKKMPINWCLSCKIGLANEEVVDGKCERCGGPTEKREKEQWMLAITKYADRLLKDLDKVDYLEKIKIQQQNWIGKTEGINIEYDVKGLGKKIVVYTTRPDTNFGATFIVVAPESNFVKENMSLFSNKKEIEKYIKESRKKSEIERIAEGRRKTGVFTGFYAVNNLNNRQMPIYVSDFVLADVGTGAVVGVPGHDMRDFEFAQEKGLDVIRVVVGPDGDKTPIRKKEQVQEESGTMINSGFLDGMEIHEATEKIKDYIEKKKWGRRMVNYHLRDWIFSRQHYWGEPIPMIHCKKCGWVPVAEKDLPVKLPDVKKYQPTDTGESPLANIKDWVNTKCPLCNGPAERETDTMPNWAGSSWYFLRYCDPHNNKELASMKKLKYWMGVDPVRSRISKEIRRQSKRLPTSNGVDWYNGGMEHTNLHLLYSRFWNKFLYDIGVVPVSEPYKKRTSQGMILGEDKEKMSKSRGNVVNPDEVVRNFGADAYRIYQMFIGPFDQAIPWDSRGIEGAKRFLNRVWKLRSKISPSSTTDNKGLEILIHQTIKKVSEDIEGMKFNTAISQLMILANEIEKENKIPVTSYQLLITLLSPFTPYIANELAEELKIKIDKWPKYDARKTKEQTFELVVQINGRVRDRVEVPVKISEEDARKLTLKRENVKKYLINKKVKKVIFVPNRLINYVCS